MATKIPIGTTAYFTSFVDGQGGGASDYFTYAENFDTNFLLLRQTINQMIDEISAVSGPNAVAALDAFLWDDDENPITTPEQKYGVVGAASYEVSIEGGGTSLKCRKGQAYVQGQRVSLISDVTGITYVGGATTCYVAIDANGTVFISNTPDDKSLDIASVAWNGSAFVAPVTHLADVFFDGDSWAEVRDRAVTPGVATFAARTFRRGAERIRACELFLAGQDTGAEGESIDGPLVGLPGSAANPSIILGDGSTTFDTDSGWYRSSSGRWGFSSGGALRYALGPNGIVFSYLGTVSLPALRTANAGIYWPTAETLAIACQGNDVLRFKAPTSLPQALLVDGAVATPALALISDEDSGWYSPAAAEWALALAGVKRFHFAAGYLRIPDGVVGTPVLAFEADPDTGIYRPGANRLAFATAGAQRGEFDAAGNLDLPTNTGAIVRRAATQSIANATATSISWDTEDRDVGNLITVPSTNLTIPTDGDGLYLVTFALEWGASATGQREIWIEVGGTVYARTRNNAASSGTTNQSTSAILSLAAANVVLGRCQQNSTAARLVTGRLTIQKIA